MDPDDPEMRKSRSIFNKRENIVGFPHVKLVRLVINATNKKRKLGLFKKKKYIYITENK